MRMVDISVPLTIIVYFIGLSGITSGFSFGKDILISTLVNSDTAASSGILPHGFLFKRKDEEITNTTETTTSTTTTVAPTSSVSSPTFIQNSDLGTGQLSTSVIAEIVVGVVFVLGIFTVVLMKRKK
jgi:hypothetical protein